MNQIVVLDSATKSSGASLGLNDLQVSFSASTTNGVKSNIGLTTGKWYCEITFNTGSHGMVGIVDSTVNMNSVIYSATGSRFYYGNNGNKYLNGTATSYGSTYAVNDTISILLDLDTKKLEFWKNGVSQGIAFTDLGSLVGGVHIGLSLGTGSAHTYTANFGATAFKYAMPTGYTRMTSINKTLILCSDGSYKKYVPPSTWQTVTSTTPTQSQFLTDGIDDLSTISQSAWETLAQTSPQIELVQYKPTGNVILNVGQTYLDIQKETAYNSLPLGQIIIEDTETNIFGDFKQILATNLDFGNSNGIVKYAVSFDNGLMWYAYKQGVWRIVSLNSVDTFKLNGMTVSEINAIPSSEIMTKATNRKIKFAYVIEESASVTVNAQIDKVQLISNVGTNTTKINQLSMYLLNTVATINMSLQGAKLTGSVSDADLTRIQYRILLNDNILYPIDGKFTVLQPSPANLNFSIPQDRILFNQTNKIKVEFQDYYGQTDFWETTFFGQYYGLMIKDKDNNYMTDNVGTPLKFMDFGIIISGQVTLAQKYKVINSYGYPLENVVIKPRYEYNESRAIIQISPTESPFVEQSEMLVGDMANNQEVEFFVRVATGFDAQPISVANFEIQVTGDKA